RLAALVGGEPLGHHRLAGSHGHGGMFAHGRLHFVTAHGVMMASQSCTLSPSTAPTEQGDQPMSYAGGRPTLDADSHLMELPDFLDPYIESSMRDRLRRRAATGLAP